MKPRTTDLDPCRSVVAHGDFVGMWSKYLEIRVEPNFDKNSLSRDGKLFSDLEQKSQGLRSGTGLEQIWGIQILDI